jgi:hypothetical protein
VPLCLKGSTYLFDDLQEAYFGAQRFRVKAGTVKFRVTRVV